MNIVINEIAILSKLVETISKSDVEFMDYHFYAVGSALEKAQRDEAAQMSQLEVLNLVELPQTEAETAWLYEHYTGAVSVDELSFIRYAMLNDCTLLTNDPVLTRVAKSLGVKVVDVSYITQDMEDNIVTDEEDTTNYLVRLFRHRPQHWNWFKTQHLQFGRVAALL